MSVPPRLASKLNETLGVEAAGDLVTWLDELRSQHAETRADFAELRQEMLAIEMRLRERTASELHALEVRLGERLDGRMKTLSDELHVVDNKIERRFSDLILWSFRVLGERRRSDRAAGARAEALNVRMAALGRCGPLRLRLSDAGSLYRSGHATGTCS